MTTIATLRLCIVVIIIIIIYYNYRIQDTLIENTIELN